jgi:hypothetical protein
MISWQPRLRRQVVPGASPGVPSPTTSAASIIPYDYAATFVLTGRPGNVVQDVINISPDGGFVAVAIGYGLEEERGRPIQLRDTLPPGPSSGGILPGDITLGNIPPEALIEGFRVNPHVAPMIFSTEPAEEFSDQPLSISSGSPSNQQPGLFERLQAPADISFLFSIVDSASGRELQDEPIHNLASLGKSNGERPFRLLAQSLSFLPRSTMRLQIIEQSEGVRGTLFIVLYGYKMFRAADCPEPMTQSRWGSLPYPTQTNGNPSARVIPFDYVATVQLAGRPGNRVESEVNVNVEGGFVATAIGYGLAAEDRDVRIQRPGAIDGKVTDEAGDGVPDATVQVENVETGVSHEVRTDSAPGRVGLYRDPLLPPGEWKLTATLPSSDIDPVDPITITATVRVEAGFTTPVNLTASATPVPDPRTREELKLTTIDLSRLPLRLFPPDALRAGFRIRPNVVRLAFADNVILARAFPIEFVDKLFERLNRPDDVSFRYTIFDSARGREIQNRLINNIAGLGIANGDRPFKKFARPMTFLPRSTIRVTVEEHFGRGTLFLVFQGYKILGASPMGGQR